MKRKDEDKMYDLYKSVTGDLKLDEKYDELFANLLTNKNKDTIPKFRKMQTGGARLK